MRQVIGLILCLFIVSACDRKCGDDIDTSTIDLQVQVKRADLASIDVKTDPDLNSWLLEHDKLNIFFTQPFRELKPEMRAAQVEAFRKSLLKTFTHPDILKLNQETQRQFSNFDSISNAFETAFKRYKYYDPSFQAPEINTLISGFGSFDCNLSGDLLVVGLEYFLKDKSTYYDYNIPNYVLAHYKPQNILPKSIMLLQDRINAFDKMDRTLLSQMIYYGKALYFSTQILPCTDEKTILEYTEAEMQEIDAAKQIIYAHFISNKLFYTEGQEVTARYINLRPSVAEIGEKCPGRIGRWLGYQIVKKYMQEHPEVSLMQLMENADAKKIFAQAKYKPAE